MEKHKFNIFPEMKDDDYSLLKQDLQANGYDESMPVYIYEGKVLDGWNRIRACKELNIEPTVKTFNGSDSEAIDFCMRTNKRRNLTSSQWACIATEATEVIEAISKAVEEARVKKIAEAAIGNDNAKVEKQPPQLIAPVVFKPKDNAKAEKQISQLIDTSVLSPNPQERTTQKVAEVFNTNRTYISDATKLKQNNPEKFKQVKSGEKTLAEVKKEEKIAKRNSDIEEQRQAIANGTAQLPAGVYEVVVIDPPWNYGREYDPHSSRVASPYPEMPQAELLALEIPFADDAVCFLWTTHAFLFDAKELLDSWGFDYKATLVWDKQMFGMGCWLRMQCEFCLVGIKGKPTWNNTTWRDIIQEQRKEHSRKPDTFYKMVNDITVGRKLDYFSRTEREGWVSFGNDTKKFEVSQ